MKIKIFALAILACLPGPAGASVASSGVLAPSAASQAAGGLSLLASSGASAAALNPAAILLLPRADLSLEGGWLLDGAQALAGAHFYAPPELATVGLSLRAERVWTPSTGGAAQSWSAGAALPIGPAGESGAGFTLRFLESAYGDPARSLGLDLGALASLQPAPDLKIRLAASVLDLDTLARHASGLERKLPQVLKVAAGLEGWGGLSLGLEQDFSHSGGSSGGHGATFHLGAEQWLKGGLALRAGYLMWSEARAQGPDESGARLNFGLGLRRRMLRADYAYSAGLDGSGASHRLGLAAAFAGPGDRERPLPLRPGRIRTGDGLVLLEWEDPQGGATASYAILMSLRPDRYFQRLEQTGGGQRAAEIRGLQNGVTYYFKVAALDAQGQPQVDTLSPSMPARPTPASAEVAELLDEARGHIDSGRAGLARAALEAALKIEPDNADAYLLLQRVGRLAAQEVP